MRFSLTDQRAEFLPDNVAQAGTSAGRKSAGMTDEHNQFCPHFNLNDSLRCVGN
jgi:hypothetical protein